MISKLRSIVKKTHLPLLILYAAATISGCGTESKPEGTAKTPEEVRSIYYEDYINKKLSLAEYWAKKGSLSLMESELGLVEGVVEKSGHDVSERVKDVYAMLINERLSWAESYAKDGSNLFVKSELGLVEGVVEKSGHDVSERVKDVYAMLINERLSWAEGFAKRGWLPLMEDELRIVEKIGEKSGQDISTLVQKIRDTYSKKKL